MKKSRNLRPNIPATTIRRNLRISRKTIKRPLTVYGGNKNNSQIIHIVREMRSHLIGEFVPTKALGKSIHVSAKNQKKRKKKK